MQHAPVTVACMCGLVASSTVLSRPLLSLIGSSSSSSSSLLSVIIKMPCTMFPIAPFASSGWTFICLLVLLFHFRQLERQWGSSRFLAFTCLSSIVGRLAAQLLVPGFTSTAEVNRLFNLVALILPIAALTTRYYTDIPSRGKTRLFRDIYVSEKILIIACAVKVLVLPQTATAIHDGVMPGVRGGTIVASVSYLSRLLLVGGGALLGYLSRSRTSIAFRGLEAFRRTICAPIVSCVLQPVLAPLCGPPTVVMHKTPPQEQAQLPRRNVAVGNLVGDDDDAIPPEVWEQIRREQEAVNNRRRGAGVREADSAGSPNTNRRNAAAGAPVGGSRTSVASAPQADPQKVALLKDLQLGVSDEDIVQALFVSGGDVDHAAAFLMEHRQHEQ